jgi:hypothetical protein
MESDCVTAYMCGNQDIKLAVRVSLRSSVTELKNAITAEDAL